MMNREQKSAIVESLKKNIDSAKAIFLTNLIGVPSNDAVKIRKTLRDAKGGLVITKNTLIERAAAGTKAEALLKGLKGPSAIAFAYEDAPGVAKAIYDASKEFEDVVTLRGGLLGEKELTDKDVVALAKLPSRDQMLATLLATFNAPLSAFVRTMDAIKRQKDEGGEATPAAAEAAPAGETKE